MFYDGNFRVLLNPDDGGVSGSGEFLGKETSEQANTSQPETKPEKGVDVIQSEPEQGVDKAQGNPWMSQLPKDLRENETLKGFKTIGDLANAYLGKKTEDTKEDEKSKNFLTFEENSKEWEDFKTKLDEKDKTGTMSRALMDVAKENGISVSQLDKVLNGMSEAGKKLEDTIKSQASTVCQRTLQQVWGDKYDNNVADMQKGYDKLIKGDKEFYMSLANAGLVNSPLVCELLRRVGTFFNTPKPYTGRVEHTSGNENPYSIPSQFYNRN